MNYRDPLFYLLTQVVGITALLSWLAYRIQYSGLDMAISGYFHDPARYTVLLRQGPALEAAGRFLLWMLPLTAAVLSGAAAVFGARFKASRPARGVLWTLLAVFCLVPLALAGLRHYTVLSGGYAASGYVLFGLYFAGWALDQARLRWWGLLVAVLAGGILGGLFVLQDPHFASQTIWSAALAWLACSLFFYPLIVTRQREGLADISRYTLGEIWANLAKVQVRRRNTLTAYGVLFVCLLPFISSTWPSRSWMHLSVEWIGLAFILAAVLGRCWCILYLGGHKGATLIQQGPYSISRNPLYLFSMLAVTGIGAQSGSIALGPILALFVYAVFNNVIDEEERLLRKVFGPQFDDYCSKVPRFGPRFKHWKVDDSLLISVSGLGNTLRDALPYFLAVPLFELIRLAQSSGWAPILIRLP
ncbi:MAG: methyltransferase [Burkholderiaceae bacterium]